MIPRKLDWKDIPVSDIKPYKGNPKMHTTAQVELVAKSLIEYGWTQPICVDKHYTLIFGHCRLDAAKQLGEEFVPAVFREDLSAAQVKALRILDNKSNESAWDTGLLEVELAELQGFDYELEDVGFDSLDDIRNANVKYSQDDRQDPIELWENMPEFEQEDMYEAKRIVVHFQALSDVAAFGKLVGQAINDKTTFIWFPKLKNLDMKNTAWVEDES